MMQSDDQKRELLWKYIEEIRCAEDPEQTHTEAERNGAACSGTARNGAAKNGAGLNGLTALSYAVHASLQAEQAENAGTTGQPLVRSRLEEAIRSEQTTIAPTIA